ncbi:MAG: hypothetical protein ACI86L_002296, partial [Dokdonia sp.]
LAAANKASEDIEILKVKLSQIYLLHNFLC